MANKEREHCEKEESNDELRRFWEESVEDNKVRDSKSRDMLLLDLAHENLADSDHVIIPFN